ncbi:MAG: hypothetical protein PVF15_03260 [Candidatus Bathyarchaeota archaeon]|jgi:hypothetical protein
MRRISLFVTIIVTLLAPFSFISSLQTEAASDLAPFTPHEVKVLIVSPADTIYSGAHYLVADLARYGFNITHHASNDAIATNFLNDTKTANLEQYDAVIIQGVLGFPTARVSAEEVAHFTSYDGILVLIGNALLQNETSGNWWSFDGEPTQRIEQRLGVDFTNFLGQGGAWHNSGVFTLADSSIEGLPVSLTYITEHSSSISYQYDLTTNGSSIVYDFNITASSVAPLIGKTTGGVTYYKAENEAVGIYVQGAYIYGAGSGNQIDYFGIADISERSSLLSSLIAFTLDRDINTIIKPQPLANVRVDGVGQYLLSTYLGESLSSFNSISDSYNIAPSVGVIDYLEFKPDYWQTIAPEILSQLKSTYRDWEITTNLRYYTDPRPMTKEQIEGLLDNIMGNYSQLELNSFSTIVAPRGLWNQSTLDAMANKSLYLMSTLDTLSSDWWDLKVNSSVIVHNGIQMLPERIAADLVENFTQFDKNSIHQKYFSQRDKLALSVLNGFPSFVYYVPNFRWNEVGTYSLQTVCENLTSEIPDIRFVPLVEAGLYFGNKWMHVENVTRDGSIIEFDIDASAIPNDVVGVEKGMLWLRISANESIQEVSIDDDPWSYFDGDSIRIPAPASSTHVKVTLGTLLSPRVDSTRYKVVGARYDGYRLNVSISCTPDLNIQVDLFLPQVGTFKTGNWTLFSPEAQWHHTFDDESRILEFQAVSDGFVTLEVGAFFLIQQTHPQYSSSVTVTVDTSVTQIEVLEVILSYLVDSLWVNVTMNLEDGRYIAEIPMRPFGTFVRYKVFALDATEHWLVTSFMSYTVGDLDPPEMEEPIWNPQSPNGHEPVSVKVSVAEPENASGVDYVRLWYYLDDIHGLANATLVNMTQENDEWICEIPSQSEGALIRFFVQAYDRAGNLEETSHLSYTVASSLPFQTIILVTGLAVGSSVAGITLYFVKFRKTSAKHKAPKEKRTRA